MRSLTRKGKKLCAWVRVRVERWVVFSLKRLLEFDVGLVMLFFFFAGSFDFFYTRLHATSLLTFSQKQLEGSR